MIIVPVPITAFSVLLTNMSDHDIDRIIRYHLEPINISIQTMNPELRCKMLHNRFAGDALKKLQKLYDAGITMNGQIVCAKELMTVRNWMTVFARCLPMHQYFRAFQ